MGLRNYLCIIDNRRCRQTTPGKANPENKDVRNRAHDHGLDDAPVRNKLVLDQPIKGVVMRVGSGKSQVTMPAVMLVLLLCLPAGLQAMSRKASVHTSHPLVSSVAGNVSVKGQGQSIWKSVERGTLLLSGDLIRTESNGRAQIRFASGTMVLYEDTEIMIPTTGPRERKKDIRSVVVKEGRALLDLSVTADEGDFRFKTGNTHGQARGSMFTVSYVGWGTAINVYRGEVRVSQMDVHVEKASSLVPGSSLRVEEGEVSCRIIRFDPRSAVKSYRKNIFPHLDATSGLPGRDETDPEGSEREELLAGLTDGDSREGSGSDTRSNGEGRDAPGEETVGDVSSSVKD